MITETQIHNVADVKMEVRRYDGFSVLRVTATDSEGRQACFSMFSDGEKITIPSIEIKDKA